MVKNRSLFILLVVALVTVCRVQASVTRHSFGRTSDGRAVDEFVLKNKNGMQVWLINYGAAIRCIKVPDRSGVVGDVALGFDHIEGYESPKNAKFGATCGRYAGQIRGAQFELEGTVYSLEDNCGGSCLHSGEHAFDRDVWMAKMVASQNAVRFSLLSPDGDDGFPGTLRVELTYTLKNDNSLWLEYRAKTNKKTVLNLLNHVYLNLSGGQQGDIRDQQIQVFSEKYVAEKGNTTTADPLAPVKGTPYDLRSPISFGKAIDRTPKKWGINTTFSLSPKVTSTPRRAIRVEDPQTGRIFECWTTEPDLNLYTANWLKNVPGKEGAVYNQHAAFCPEAMRYAPKPGAPATLLFPDELYRQTTVYRFGVLKK